MPDFRIKAFGKYLSSFLSGHPVCFINLFLTALTSGVEQTIEDFAFQCPTNRTLATWMGLLYLLGPPVVFTSITMALNTEIWFVCHGCCSKRDEPPKPPDANTNPPINSPIPDANTNDESHHALILDSVTEKMYRRHLRTGKSIWFRILFRVVLVAFVWVITALFDGDYIACAFANGEEKIVLMKECSRCAAWIILLSIVILGALGHCISRCCDKKTYLQKLYEETYWPKFQKEAKRKAIQKAKEDAETLVVTIEPGSGTQEPDNGTQAPGNRTQEPGNRTQAPDNRTQESDSFIPDAFKCSFQDGFGF